MAYFFNDELNSQLPSPPPPLFQNAPPPLNCTFTRLLSVKTQLRLNKLSAIFFFPNRKSKILLVNIEDMAVRVGQIY